MLFNTLRTYLQKLIVLTFLWASDDLALDGRTPALVGPGHDAEHVHDVLHQLAREEERAILYVHRHAATLA